MELQLKDLNKSFGSVVAASDINLEISGGKLVALLGPSGSGKTTVLRMIAGLERPDSGEIVINGQVVNNIEPSKRGIGFVFQNYALFRYMTVYDNIAFGLKVQKKSKAEIAERVQELLLLTGLSGLDKRYPNQLSGGQRQRVAFARALAPRPQLLLLDEPFAAIDAKVRQELRSWLKEMIERLGITSIFVTHDQDEAVEVADEIILMNRGVIEQKGSPIDIYKSPSTPFVAQFIGTSSVIDDYASLRGFEQQGDYRQAVIRPEFVEAFKADNDKYQALMDVSEEAVIEDIAFRGSYLELKLRIGDMLLSTNRSLERRPVSRGEKLRVVVYRMYVFDEERAMLLENSLLRDVDILSY